MNHFMLECASICPETTHQNLESQRFYYSLKPWSEHVVVNVP